MVLLAVVVVVVAHIIPVPTLELHQAVQVVVGQVAK
jgi:hypothetical protein